jgi:hypothetical protein
MRDNELPRAYYNEIDPYAAQWLRNLIDEGHIAPGDVDQRSIVDVQPDDLIGYTQCHFFAGIGGWSYAARLAGWPDERPLWTGSCPCQPHSAAAADRRRGFADERGLWPVCFNLISKRRPDVFLVSRLTTRLHGSTERSLTWKRRTLPSRRLIYRLVPSIRPTSECEIFCGPPQPFRTRRTRQAHPNGSGTLGR